MNERRIDYIFAHLNIKMQCYVVRKPTGKPVGISEYYVGELLGNKYRDESRLYWKYTAYWVCRSKRLSSIEYFAISIFLKVQRNAPMDENIDIVFRLNIVAFFMPFFISRRIVRFISKRIVRFVLVSFFSMFSISDVDCFHSESSIVSTRETESIADNVLTLPIPKGRGFLLHPPTHWPCRNMQRPTQCPQARLYCSRMPYGAVLIICS